MSKSGELWPVCGVDAAHELTIIVWFPLGAMQSYISRLGLSALFVFAAFGCGFIQWPYMRPTSIILLYIAVAAASWFYGVLAGLFATGLSVVLVAYNLMPPVHSLKVDVAGVIFLSEFTIIAVGVSYVISSIRQALRIAQRDALLLRNTQSELRNNEERWRALAESVPNLIWTCRADGSADYVSPQWKAYTGESAGNQKGYRWLLAIHPADRDRVCGEWETATKAQVGFESTCRIRSAAGNYRWFKMRAVPFLGPGEAYWVGTCTDVNDIDVPQKQAGEPLRSNS